MSMGTGNKVDTGNVAVARCRFHPRAGTGPVALADVTADIVEPADQAASLVVTQLGTNWFQASHLIPVGADPRAWRVEWASNPPSPIGRKTHVFYVTQA